MTRYLPVLPDNFKGFVVVAIGGLLLCAFFGVFGSRGWTHLQELRRQQARAEQIAFRLARHNEQLREHIEKLAVDDVYLERVTRERLFWIKPGEIIFRTERVRSPVSAGARDVAVGAK